MSLLEFPAGHEWARGNETNRLTALFDKVASASRPTSSLKAGEPSKLNKSPGRRSLLEAPLEGPLKAPPGSKTMFYLVSLVSPDSLKMWHNGQVNLWF